MNTMRDVSKQNFVGGNTTEAIQTGCLQRIADATEHMAKRFVELQDELQRQKDKLKLERAWRERLQRRCIALKGVVTRMKGKLHHDAELHDVPASEP